MVDKFIKLHWGDSSISCPITNDDWLKVQMEDPNLRRFIEKAPSLDHQIHSPGLPPGASVIRVPLSEGSLVPGPLVIKAAKIEKASIHGVTIQSSRLRLQIIVPPRYYECIMYSCHDARGHPGAKRTLEVMRERYYWPTMPAYIKLYVHRCRHCRCRKVDLHQGAIPLLEHIKAWYPWHIVHMDLMGPFPITAKGNQ
jgi:hypothetical protein